jgi:hypothetical protein
VADVVKIPGDVEKEGGADQATGMSCANVVLETEACVNSGRGISASKLGCQDEFEAVNVKEETG